MRLRRPVAVLSLSVAAALGAAACGDDDSSDAPSRAATTQAAAAATPAATSTPAPPPTSGSVGDALELQEQYELNGEPTTVDLRVRVIKVVGVAAAPDEFSKAKPGSRWVRLRVKFTNQSDDPIQQSVEDITVVTSNDEEYSVQGYPFQPSLGHNVTKLRPGQSRVGFVAAEVPRDARLKEVRMSGAYVEPLVWDIGSS